MARRQPLRRASAKSRSARSGKAHPKATAARRASQTRAGKPGRPRVSSGSATRRQTKNVGRARVRDDRKRASTGRHAPARARRARAKHGTAEIVVRTPPSSLRLDRRGSAARTGRAGLAHSLRDHPGMSPALTGGDIDADWENAYFSGDEAPGGDNPTPDQEVVDEIGHALGVDYQDSEELRSTDKVTERDKHRWELDPASSEDYKDRK